MAEQLVLTTPQTTSVTTYAVRAVLLSRNPADSLDTHIRIVVLDNAAVESVHSYTGAEAFTLLQQLNTMNFSTTSFQRRVLQRLVADGRLPAGTVTGTPD